MIFKIVNKTENRVRIRLGKYIFTKEQGYGLSAMLLTIKGISKVETSHINGSILIVHEDGFDCDVFFKKIHFLKISDLVSALPSEEEKIKEQEDEFKNDLVKHFLKHYVSKLIVPNFLYPYYVFVKGIPYMKKGLVAVSNAKMSVDLLDATAISLTLFSKNYTTASSTMFLLKLSDLLLDYSNARAKNQLASSLSLTNGQVWKIDFEGNEILTSINELKVSDVVRVRKGFMIPVDGTVVNGLALINEATMTGEPLSVEKRKDSTVFAGTLVEDGEIDVKVRTTGGQTRIAKIVDLINDGEEVKASIQGRAENLADEIVPLSFGLFLGTFLITRNFSRALSVLMVDFSCAIKLTTPIAVISALKESAENKILVKGGKYLELLSQIDTVVFDKTGTLTEAVPKVSKIIAVNEDYQEDKILRIAACLEEHFPHSVAASIVNEAKSRGLEHPEDHGKVEYIVAHGIASTYKGVKWFIGSKHFIFEDEKIPYPHEKEEFLNSEIGTDSAVYLAVEGSLVGIICINDPPRRDAKEAIKMLKQSGIKKIVMITGDSEATAKNISNKLDLDEYFAAVLPDGKVNLIENLKANGSKVLMVGDGINDAPALSCADVSITLQGSSDIAREVSDITILSHSLTDIIYVRNLSNCLMSKIKTQYGLIATFNTALILLGVSGVLTASQTALFHNISTVYFASSSSRSLLKKKVDS